MEKEIRRNQVAVLISPSFGAGWYSWNRSHPELLFSPKIIWMVERNRSNQIDEDWVLKNLGISGIYCGGAKGLEIHWLPVGTAFEVKEDAGAESLVTLTNLVLVA